MSIDSNYTLPRTEPQFRIRDNRRTYICQICGKTGTTTSRNQNTCPGECVRIRRNRSTSKAMKRANKQK